MSRLLKKSPAFYGTQKLHEHLDIRLYINYQLDTLIIIYS